MSEKRVKVVNKVKSIVVLSDPDIPFRREWTKKGQIQSIPMDIMQDLIYQEGVRTMFDEGVLAIDSQEDRIALGLEIAGEVPEVQFFTDNQMLGALYGTAKELEIFINKLPKAQREELIELAVEKEITSMDKVDVIKRLTGRDVLKLVQYNRQLKEPDREQE